MPVYSTVTQHKSTKGVELAKATLATKLSQPVEEKAFKAKRMPSFAEPK